MSEEGSLTPNTAENAEGPATFEELCSMLERGMDEEQALSWAAGHGLRITEEQRDHLERDLEIFDTDLLPDAEGEAPEPGQSQPVGAPNGLEKKKPEPKKLTKLEMRNAALGVLIVLAFLIALRRFLMMG